MVGWVVGVGWGGALLPLMDSCIPSAEDLYLLIFAVMHELLIVVLTCRHQDD